MKAIYDIRPGDVWWTASDVGWVVGHSYICYAPLLIGATTVMYEGKPVGTPDAGAFWRVLAESRATALFTAPTALRAIRRADPDGTHIEKYDLSAFRTLFMAGERLDPDTLHWAHHKLGVPVIDHWWQTETGWPICANLRGLDRSGARLGRAHPRPRRRTAAGRPAGRDRHQTAAAARIAAHAVARRSALHRRIPVSV
jgi:propionyl-CoA synthetase